MLENKRAYTVMKFFLVSICLLFFGLNCFGQERLESPVGFSIDKPKGWSVVEKIQLDKSVQSLALSAEKIEKILQTGKNSVLVFAFSKRSPNEASGPIPTIQVRLRNNPIADFDEFLEAFVRSVSPERSPFEGYEFVGYPEEIEISGLRSVIVKSKYILRGRDGTKANTSARTYAIPNGNHYFQITMIDVPGNGDSSSTFDELLKSIRIKKLGN